MNPSSDFRPVSIRDIPSSGFRWWSHFWPCNLWLQELVPLLASVGPNPALRTLAYRDGSGLNLGPLALSGGPTPGLAISGFKCRSHFWLRLVPPLASVGWSYFWLRSVLLLASVGPTLGLAFGWSTLA